MPHEACRVHHGVSAGSVLAATRRASLLYETEHAMGIYACIDHETCVAMHHRVARRIDPVVITAAVGALGRNLNADVSTIQNALNRIGAGDGGAEDSLVVDGWYGSKTGGAIHRFQLRQFPGWKPDDTIEPGKKTIDRINLLLGLKARPLVFSLAALGDAMPPELAKAYACVPGILARIRSARRRLQDVRDSTASPGTHTASGVNRRLVDWHFKAHRASSPRAHLDAAIRVYDTMERVLFMETRTGSPFQLFLRSNDPAMNERAAAWTEYGGYDYAIDARHPNGDYYHAIYIAPQFENKVYAEMILLHELAHFCGGREGTATTIGHRAHPSPPKLGRALEDGAADYARMSPADALRNAQSYQFLCAPEHPLFMPPDPLPPEAR